MKNSTRKRITTGLFAVFEDEYPGMCNDCASNPLLNVLVIDFDDELGVYSAARDSDQSNSPDCFFAHAMVNVRGCEIPRSVLQADTIFASCGLANFETVFLVDASSSRILGVA